MKPRIAVFMVIVILTYGCSIDATPPVVPPDGLHGIASWYGEEFAGRTTANGEIFDPLLLTAAHRTLPFGTVLDITNPKTRQTVRVRVNDRGPYIGNRIIDLSFAAAQQIGLIESGVGEVEIAVVRVGSGEREPPAPMEITIGEAPKIELPIVEPRKQVADDGKTIISGAADFSPPATRRAEARRSTTFVVQVGAFALEANARLLQDRLITIGQRAWIDRNDLYRVRIGPFATRDQAVQTRSVLEASGLSAIIVNE